MFSKACKPAVHRYSAGWSIGIRCALTCWYKTCIRLCICLCIDVESSDHSSSYLYLKDTGSSLNILILSNQRYFQLQCHNISNILTSVTLVLEHILFFMISYSDSTYKPLCKYMTTSTVWGYNICSYIINDTELFLKILMLKMPTTYKNMFCDLQKY